MTWDHQLLRRFSSTSHFRLLNQVRSELRSQPLNRDPKTKLLNLETKPSQGYNIKSNNLLIFNMSAFASHDKIKAEVRLYFAKQICVRQFLKCV